MVCLVLLCLLELALLAELSVRLCNMLVLIGQCQTPPSQTPPYCFEFVLNFISMVDASVKKNVLSLNRHLFLQESRVKILFLGVAPPLLNSFFLVSRAQHQSGIWHFPSLGRTTKHMPQPRPSHISCAASWTFNVWLLGLEELSWADLDLGESSKYSPHRQTDRPYCYCFGSQSGNKLSSIDMEAPSNYFR